VPNLAPRPHLSLGVTAAASVFLLALTTSIVCGIVPACRCRGSTCRACCAGRAAGDRPLASARSRRRGRRATGACGVLLRRRRASRSQPDPPECVHPGFDTQGLITFQVPFARSFYKLTGNTPTGGLEVEVSSRLNLLTERNARASGGDPGIESTASAMTVPLGGHARRFGVAATARQATARSGTTARRNGTR